ncbi:MAG: ubiquinol-cytochrome c reductase iron-sulfur subunit [Acidobacteriota bacterium]|nr:ubiquinol-cytochrome c reductase iron-sulfur subunit [Acidobacteriota bacterium]
MTPETEPDAPGPTRRRFYLSFIYGLGAIMGAALAAPALVYLFLPPKLGRQNEWVEAGDVSQLTPKIPAEMVFRKTRTDGWRVTSEKKTAWVVKLADNNVVAFGPQCTHLGCAYHWDETNHQFLCPCHTSVFALDGSVISGPAPRPLDRYEIKIAKNKLLLGELREGMESPNQSPEKKA